MRKAHMVGGRSKKGKIDGKRVFDLYAGSSAGTGLLPRLWHIEKYI